MRIFLAGATGVLGRNLIPRLLERGHSVVGTTSSTAKFGELQKLGVEPVLMNGTDRESVFAAVRAAKADVVVNQMTALANVRDYKNFDTEFALTNRLRAEGTAHLLSAAKETGAKKIVVQSFAGWPFVPDASGFVSEESAYNTDVPAKMRQSLRAIRQMEEAVLSSASPAGVALRYGFFYGPGTSFDPATGDIPAAIRKGALPVVTGGSGAWSFTHIEDAAEATRLAIESARSGAYNIVDDTPVAITEWLPEVARMLGAKPPKRVPAWLGRFFAGAAGVYLMTEAPGSRNEKAKRVFGWQPMYADWRAGFAELLRKA